MTRQVASDPHGPDTREAPVSPQAFMQRIRRSGIVARTGQLFGSFLCDSTPDT